MAFGLARVIIINMWHWHIVSPNEVSEWVAEAACVSVCLCLCVYAPWSFCHLYVFCGCCMGKVHEQTISPHIARLVESSVVEKIKPNQTIIAHSSEAITIHWISNMSSVLFPQCMANNINRHECSELTIAYGLVDDDRCIHFPRSASQGGGCGDWFRMFESGERRTEVETVISAPLSKFMIDELWKQRFTIAIANGTFILVLISVCEYKWMNKFQSSANVHLELLNLKRKCYMP